MSDILDLEGWTLLTRTQQDGWDVLGAEYRPQPAACPKCGTIGHLYRHGTKQMLPGIPVVVDKFHVVRTASYCMERVRIRLQKKRVAGIRKLWLQSKATLNKRYSSLNDKAKLNLEIWLANEPELAEAYRLKEAFYDIYDMPKEQAVAAFDAFPAKVPAMLAHDFKVLLTAMRNWRKEILAYFDHPITNAYTEAVNGVAKTVNRAGRGYSFDVLRARLLFGKKAKPEQQTWLLVSAFDTSVTAIQYRLKEQDGRCGLCAVEIGRAADTRPVAATLLRRSTRKQVVICHGCMTGFHTQGLFRKVPRSTRESG